MCSYDGPGNMQEAWVFMGNSFYWTNGMVGRDLGCLGVQGTLLQGACKVDLDKSVSTLRKVPCAPRQV